MKINKKVFKKGITLLETMIYMIVFIVVVTISIYMSIFIQKQHVRTVRAHTAKSEVYTHIYIFQQYAVYASEVRYGDGFIELDIRKKYIKKIRFYRDSQKNSLCFQYTYVNIYQKTICSNIQNLFTQFQIEAVDTKARTLSSSSLYMFIFGWNTGFVKEYLYIPKNSSL